MSNAVAALIEALASGNVTVVDLTQPLDENTPVIELPDMFAASPGVSIELISKYDDKGPAWYWNTLTMGEHTGTHFDAPIHWITGKDTPNGTTDTIPPSKLVTPAVVVDVSAETAADDDYLMTPQRIQEWESEHGQIPAGAWFLMRTDWSKRQGREAFLNAREDGPHSPGFSPAAVQFLIEERDVLGVGVETVGTDAGQASGFDPAFPCHTLMHGAGKLGLASLTNLDQLPPTGALIIAAPLKIVNGSGSPLRVLALVSS
jgi:kynurenine formamidase